MLKVVYLNKFLVDVVVIEINHHVIQDWNQNHNGK